MLSFITDEDPAQVKDQSSKGEEVDDDPAQLYIDLLKKTVLNLVYGDPSIGLEESAYEPFDRDRRIEGRDWPSQAFTMIGLERLNNIQFLVEDILRSRTPGDLIETGVWRGGATIFMRGLLKAHGVLDRNVWVADSFQGFPRTEAEGLSEKSYTSEFLTEFRQETIPPAFKRAAEKVRTDASLEAVQDHFERLGLLDDQVKFLPGWFRDTLPDAPIQSLSLLRADGDLYDSTYDVLSALYPKVSANGYVIVDDYGTFSECKQAVHDYLSSIGERVEINWIDEGATYWKKTGN